MSERTPQPERSDSSDPTRPNEVHQSETVQIWPSTTPLPSDEPGHEPEPVFIPATGSTTYPLSSPATEPTVEPAAAMTPAPATDSRVEPASGRRGIRVRTVVFGAVMLVISIVTLVALTTGVRVDGAAIGLTLLLGAGAILVAGGAASAVREARGGPGAGR
ncbi:MAG TPA: hypothetical protein VHN80_04255 [Kineosporiaceae bacterium]|nr:hypothetical protein [Kineosporiaceae bacterium]